MKDISTSHEISGQMMKEEIVAISASGVVAYHHKGIAHSAFQRNEVVVRFEFKSGEVMCGLLSPVVPLPGLSR